MKERENEREGGKERLSKRKQERSMLIFAHLCAQA